MAKGYSAAIRRQQKQTRASKAIAAAKDIDGGRRKASIGKRNRESYESKMRRAAAGKMSAREANNLSRSKAMGRSGG